MRKACPKPAHLEFMLARVSPRICVADAESVNSPSYSGPTVKRQIVHRDNRGPNIAMAVAYAHKMVKQ